MSKKHLLIGDSNGERILPFLPKNWWLAEGARTIDDLDRMTDLDHGFTTITILLGTNNVKHRDTEGLREARRILNKAEDLAREHTNTQIFVMQLPPIGRRHAQAERLIFNMTLNMTETERVKIVNCPATIEDTPLAKILTDDLHLNEEAARKYAQAMTDAEREHGKTDKPNEKLETTNKVERRTSIPENKAGALIGKAGKNIREIERKTSVKITVGRGDPTPVTVEGEHQRNVDEAIKMVEEYKREMGDRKKQEKRIECRYFARGMCNKGMRCPYDHTIKSTYNRSRSRDSQTTQRRSRSRDSQTTQRRRSRSGDSRDNSRGRKIIITADKERRVVSRK